MKNKNLYLITAGVLTFALLTSTSSKAMFGSFFGKESEVTVSTQSLSAEESVETEADDSQEEVRSLTESETVSNITDSTNESNSNLYIATVDGESQVLETEHSPSTYPNIVVQKGKSLTWTISASAQSILSCNSYVVFPDFDIQTVINEGENTIEFTPEETGTFQYYCSMGMYVGTITVVDDVENFDEASVLEEVDGAVLSGGGGCCGF